MDLERPETPAHDKQRPYTITQEIQNGLERLTKYWRLTCVKKHGYGEGDVYEANRDKFHKDFVQMLEGAELLKWETVVFPESGNDAKKLRFPDNKYLYRFFVAVAVVWGLEFEAVNKAVHGGSTEPDTAGAFLAKHWDSEVAFQEQKIANAEKDLEERRAKLKGSAIKNSLRVKEGWI
ncbi:hypothetical protein HBI84_171690 [Parastagonospora nodorum]|nr:hypothetical protein HBI84_171690 [Parastagonospora nodorum]